MRALLWTLIVVGAINTVGCLITRFEPPMKVGHRIADAIYTAGIAAWALWLLAKGGAV